MNLIQFLNSSPVNYLAVATLEEQLQAAGFRKIDPTMPMPDVRPGDKLYFTKNDSSLYAIRLGSKPLGESGIRIICAHCDSPTFRIKPNPEILMEKGFVKLNTEIYGGAIMSTWFDRPLSLAGRVMLRTSDPLHPQTRLLHIKEPILIIPNLAIHFNRQVNDGVKLSKQKDMLPVLGIIDEELCADNLLLNEIAKNLDVAPEDILDFDLYLYDTTPACEVGLNKEFISAGRLDDLSMVHAGLQAMLGSVADNKKKNQNQEQTMVLAIFDNEETGSGTKQGAGSPFLAQVLQRLVLAQSKALGLTTNPFDDFYRMIENSFMVSADNAHAWHPNYGEKMDPTNHPVLGGGPIIKVNAAQKYASDADGAAVFSEICRRAGVPYQRFVNHSDIAGGSTLGNILTSSLPFRGVDMGNGVWGMHSIRETGSVKDQEYVIKAFTEFFWG
ncbi:MAG: M18 family aminopeptidase [Bacteroidales bacterium]|nr:M18 family aminopeptidase [Bacteroidales bacterium]